VARRLLLLPLVFGLYACASTASRSPEDATAALDRDMLETGLSDIDSIYITQQNIPELTLVGLQQISSLDPDLTVEGDSDELKLLLKKTVIETEKLADGEDASCQAMGQGRGQDPARSARKVARR
jgi:hypothetical protein